MGVIYKLNFASGKSYIGMTTKPFQKRFAWHKTHSLKDAQLINKAWRKYGQPTFEILAELPDDKLLMAEIAAIKEHNTLTPHGYNMTTGGEICPAQMPEIAKRISISSLGKKMSLSSRKKMSDSQKALYKSGYIHPMLGRKQSEKALLQMRKPHTKEHIEKTRLANLGRKHTQEFKDKVSLRHRGKITSDETKLKMSIARKQYFINKKAA